MKTIHLDGVVGWDVLAADFREALEAADGDDIDLAISSPGGSVYEGLAIYNAIRDYRRAGGKVTARVIGLAASMATYIPLAADQVIVEDNAVWMIHNPWSIALGDQNDMRKEADILDGIASVLAKAYVQQSGKSVAEVRGMMDEETWLFGDEIVAAGFADRAEPAGDGAEDQDEAVDMARTAVEAMKHTMKTEPEKQQLDKAAALIREIKAVHEPGVAGKNTAAQAENNEEGAMDIKALEKEHPDVFAAAVQIGVEQERVRINALREYTEADPENSKLAEVVNAAIAGGQTVEQVNAKLQVAIRDGKLAGENPPMVETTPNAEVLTDEEIALIQNLVITEEAYRAQKGGK